MLVSLTQPIRPDVTDMLIAILFLGLGLTLLLVGGDVLVRGAAGIARRLGLSTFIIGMTVVAFGTSTPELVVAVGAAVKESPDIALGNVVGSNIANIGLVLGLTAMVYPIVCHSEFIAREVTVMLCVTGITVVAMWDNILARHEGVGFIIGFLALMYYLYRRGKAEGPAAVPGMEEELEKMHGVAPEADQIKRSPWLWLRDVVIAVIGAVLLVVGGELTVNNAVKIATLMEVPEKVVALTIVAIGTSLPELAVSVAAAFRRHPDMVIGNVVGSNIYNLLLVAGTAAAVAPLETDGFWIELIVLLAISLATLPIVLSGRKITRLEGVILFVAYSVYIGALGWQAL